MDEELMIDLFRSSWGVMPAEPRWLLAGLLAVLVGILVARRASWR